MELIPPDSTRCQCFITPAHGPFRFGPRSKPEQCSNLTTFIATEKKPGADGEKGSMSICLSCYMELVKQIAAGDAPEVDLEAL